MLSVKAFVYCKVDGEILSMEQRPANAEAREQATTLLQELQAQRDGSRNHVSDSLGDAFVDVPREGLWDEDAEADGWGAGLADGDNASGLAEPATLTATTAAGQAADISTDGLPASTDPIPASSAKPLVEAPEFGDRVRDTDKEPYWIPGAFPTIFQNETGDLHNYVLKEPDLLTWGPHIMRSRGWHAQAHMTFCYWWLNMVQRSQALSAKKWYVRDNPQATGYTLDDLREMSVKALAKNMVGYTQDIPGTRASKAKLRRIILTMVKQIEIETSTAPGVENADARAGDVPSLFGTLTTQRYHWDDIISIIAMVEGIDNYQDLSKSKRRELVEAISHPHGIFYQSLSREWGWLCRQLLLSLPWTNIPTIPPETPRGN